MKNLVFMLLCGALALVFPSGQLLAQTATGAEARLRERNITLPPVPPPVANYVELSACRELTFSCWKHGGS